MNIFSHPVELNKKNIVNEDWTQGTTFGNVTTQSAGLHQTAQRNCGPVIWSCDMQQRCLLQSSAQCDETLNR